MNGPDLSLSPEAKTQLNAWRSEATNIANTHGENSPEAIRAQRTLLNAVVAMIGLGGRVIKESDRMLTGRNEFIAYGIHFDGKEWSVHS